MFQSCWIMNRCFEGFYLVIQIVSEATWHSLNFPRDQSTKIRHVSLQMESMKLKRVEQAGKQRQSDIIPGESPEKFWPRFCFETFVRYNIVVAIVDAWSHKVFMTWSIEVLTYRGCLKHWSHYLKLSWAVTNITRLQTSHRTSLNECNEHDPKIAVEVLIMSHDMTFAFVWLCGVHLTLSCWTFFILKFHEAFKGHLRAVTMLSLIDGSSQS